MLGETHQDEKEEDDNEEETNEVSICLETALQEDDML